MRVTPYPKTWQIAVKLLPPLVNWGIDKTLLHCWSRSPAFIFSTFRLRICTIIEAAVLASEWLTIHNDSQMGLPRYGRWDHLLYDFIVICTFLYIMIGKDEKRPPNFYRGALVLDPGHPTPADRWRLECHSQSHANAPLQLWRRWEWQRQSNGAVNSDNPNLLGCQNRQN